MKIIAISNSDKFKGFRIGEDSTSSRWYAWSPKVEKFVKNFKKGDEVKIGYDKTDDGKLSLNFIQKIGGAPASPEDIEYDPNTSAPTSAPVAKQTPVEPASQPKTWGKTPDEQASIKRQAIGHMTSRTLISLQGHITPENVETLMEQIYNKYVELVG